MGCVSGFGSQNQLANFQSPLELGLCTGVLPQTVVGSPHCMHHFGLQFRIIAHVATDFFCAVVQNFSGGDDVAGCCVGVRRAENADHEICDPVRAVALAGGAVPLLGDSPQLDCFGDGGASEEKYGRRGEGYAEPMAADVLPRTIPGAGP